MRMTHEERLRRLNEKNRRRRLAETREVATICTFTNEFCEIAMTCHWSEQNRRRTRGCVGGLSKIDACAYAVETDVESCGHCDMRRSCSSTWTCFRLAMWKQGISVADFLDAPQDRPTIFEAPHKIVAHKPRRFEQ